MFALLIPLLLSVAPKVAGWLLGDKAADVAGDVAGVVKSITGTSDEREAVEALKADPEKLAAFQAQMAKIQADREDAKEKALNDKIAQVVALTSQITSTNNAEAAKDNVFIAGWRPFVGWVCASGIGFASIVVPVIQTFSGRHVDIDTGTLITLLVGMLGIGGMRTVEKLSGASTTAAGK